MIRKAQEIVNRVNQETDELRKSLIQHFSQKKGKPSFDQFLWDRGLKIDYSQGATEETTGRAVTPEYAADRVMALLTAFANAEFSDMTSVAKLITELDQKGFLSRDFFEWAALNPTDYLRKTPAWKKYVAGAGALGALGVGAAAAVGAVPATIGAVGLGATGALGYGAYQYGRAGLGALGSKMGLWKNNPLDDYPDIKAVVDVQGAKIFDQLVKALSPLQAGSPKYAEQAGQLRDVCVGADSKFTTSKTCLQKVDTLCKTFMADPEMLAYFAMQGEGGTDLLRAIQEIGRFCKQMKY